MLGCQLTPPAEALLAAVDALLLQLLGATLALAVPTWTLCALSPVISWPASASGTTALTDRPSEAARNTASRSSAAANASTASPGTGEPAALAAAPLACTALKAGRQASKQADTWSGGHRQGPGKQLWPLQVPVAAKTALEQQIHRSSLCQADAKNLDVWQSYLCQQLQRVTLQDTTQQ